MQVISIKFIVTVDLAQREKDAIDKVNNGIFTSNGAIGNTYPNELQAFAGLVIIHFSVIEFERFCETRYDPHKIIIT